MHRWPKMARLLDSISQFTQHSCSNDSHKRTYNLIMMMKMKKMMMVMMVMMMMFPSIKCFQRELNGFKKKSHV